jgi:hypothetical protein
MNLRILTTVAVLCSAFVVATVLPHSGFAQSTLVGTWKLNLEKSKYSPGPAPKSGILTYEAVGQGYKVSNEGMNAKGDPTKSVFGPFSNDGKPSPVTGVPDFDESTYKQVNDTTVEFTRLKAGTGPDRDPRTISGWQDPDLHEHGY